MKTEIVNALLMLRLALNDYDIDIAHHILIGECSDDSVDSKEREVVQYIEKLTELIEKVRESQF